MLDTLVRASIDGAIFAALVWILSRTVSCLPAAAKAFLWWCVAAKFVVALVWTTPVFVPLLPAPGPASPTTAPIVHSSSSGVEPAVEAAEAGARTIPWSMVVLIAWGLGCGVAVYRGFGRWRNVRSVAARASRAPEHLQSMTADLAALIGLRRLPDVRISEDVVTPLVAGLRRPVVLLPLTRFTALSAARQRMTLCHELVHLKRWDLFLGWIPAAAEPLFFFHPLAHVAAREYLFWREAACDAAVLEALDVAPQEYGGLLLDLGVVGSRSSLAAAGAPWSFSILKRRIVMLRDPSSRSITTRALAPTLAVLALAAIAPLQLSARPATAATPPEAGTVATEASAPDDVQSASTQTRADKLTYVMFFDDNQTMMSGSVPGDINRAKSFRRTGEPMLWFRMSGREYVVRDAEVLRDIENAWSGPKQVGAEQGDVGARQGRIGAKQGEIGAKQSVVGAEQAVIGSKQSAIGERQGRLAARESARSLTDAQQKEIDTERRALDDQMKEQDREMRKLDDRMRELDAPMRELDEQMKVLDKEMSGLDRRMEEAVKRAEELMQDILRRAISSGTAQAVK